MWWCRCDRVRGVAVGEPGPVADRPCGVGRGEGDARSRPGEAGEVVSEYIELSGSSPNGVGPGTAWAGEASLFTPPEPWMQGASCASADPEAFFPLKGGSSRAAKNVCLRCDVRAECLAYALEHDERFGIWGGVSERERARMRRRLAERRAS